MRTVSVFRRKRAAAHRLWDEGNYDAALEAVEVLRAAWPGNPQVLVMWASLVQLQENPAHDLDDARSALQQAVERDRSSPAAGVELGHFLDAVDDDPQAAAKAYSDAVATARRLMIEGLIGEAKALVQSDRRGDARARLLEALQLNGRNGPFADQLGELLPEVFAASNGRSLPE